MSINELKNVIALAQEIIKIKQEKKQKIRTNVHCLIYYDNWEDEQQEYLELKWAEEEKEDELVDIFRHIINDE